MTTIKESSKKAPKNGWVVKDANIIAGWPMFMIFLVYLVNLALAGSIAPCSLFVSGPDRGVSLRGGAGLRRSCGVWLCLVVVPPLSSLDASEPHEASPKNPWPWLQMANFRDFLCITVFMHQLHLVFDQHLCTNFIRFIT